jgi:hypothetical protein
MSEFVGGKYGLCYGCSPDVITAEKIELMLEQINEMKCCGNCKHYIDLGELTLSCNKGEKFCESGTFKCDKWEKAKYRNTMVKYE